MEKLYFNVEKDGFYGAYYSNSKVSDKAVILMLGDAIDDRMVVSGVKWLLRWAAAKMCHSKSFN